MTTGLLTEIISLLVKTFNTCGNLGLSLRTFSGLAQNIITMYIYSIIIFKILAFFYKFNLKQARANSFLL